MKSALQRGESASIYLHFPCFDGVVSGVLAILFLGKLRGWRFDSIHGVNYELQANWSETRLSPHSCVVDFLYHPEAEFWCDHHPTTFLNSNLRADFASRQEPLHIYDDKSQSSARLVWNKGAAILGRARRLEEMVDWADRIDAAEYEDVNEALFGTHPALQISRSLAVDADSRYCDLLVRKLCVSSLREVAAHPEVQRRVLQANQLSREGLRNVQKQMQLHGNIALFDVLTENSLVSRYSAFYFHPKVEYSVGIFRSNDSIIIRVNTNPWLRFESPNLGEMMRAAARKIGLASAGGGHANVGSLRLGKESQSATGEIVTYFVNKLHRNLKAEEGSEWQRAATR